MTIDISTRPDTGALARAVGAQIRSIRKSKNMTLNDLARACGTTPQTIQRLEMGNMTLSVDWIEAICIALGAEPYEIFPHQNRNVTAQLETMRTEAEVLKIRLVDCIGRIEEFLKETE
jgi:transcriptional regulator with XRE-family HTH domain